MNNWNNATMRRGTSNPCRIKPVVYLTFMLTSAEVLFLFSRILRVAVTTIGVIGPAQTTWWICSARVPHGGDDGDELTEIKKKAERLESVFPFEAERQSPETSPMDFDFSYAMRYEIWHRFLKIPIHTSPGSMTMGGSNTGIQRQSSLFCTTVAPFTRTSTHTTY